MVSVMSLSWTKPDDPGIETAAYNKIFPSIILIYNMIIITVIGPTIVSIYSMEMRKSILIIRILLFLSKTPILSVTVIRILPMTPIRNLSMRLIRRLLTTVIKMLMIYDLDYILMPRGIII